MLIFLDKNLSNEGTGSITDYTENDFLPLWEEIIFSINSDCATPITIILLPLVSKTSDVSDKERL